MGLTARALESAGIVTVVVGAAEDILRHCGTPRTVFNDLPLGNPVGKPWDAEMQLATMSTALELAESATMPGTLIQTPFRWSEDDAWKKTFMRLDHRDPQELLALGEENRAARRANRASGLVRQL